MTTIFRNSFFEHNIDFLKPYIPRVIGLQGKLVFYLDSYRIYGKDINIRLDRQEIIITTFSGALKHRSAESLEYLFQIYDIRFNHKQIAKNINFLVSTDKKYYFVLKTLGDDKKLWYQAAVTYHNLTKVIKASYIVPSQHDYQIMLDLKSNGLRFFSNQSEKAYFLASKNSLVFTNDVDLPEIFIGYGVKSKQFFSVRITDGGQKIVDLTLDPTQLSVQFEYADYAGDLVLDKENIDVLFQKFNPDEIIPKELKAKVSLSKFEFSDIQASVTYFNSLYPKLSRPHFETKLHFAKISTGYYFSLENLIELSINYQKYQQKFDFFVKTPESSVSYSLAYNFKPFYFFSNFTQDQKNFLYSFTYENATTIVLSLDQNIFANLPSRKKIMVSQIGRSFLVKTTGNNCSIIDVVFDPSSVRFLELNITQVEGSVSVLPKSLYLTGKMDMFDFSLNGFLFRKV